MSRSDVTFRSGGETCAGWLYGPGEQGGTPRPIVVMAHGLGAVKEMGLAPYAESFASAGYAVLLFDYRHFGASGGTPRQLLDIGRQLEDYAAAVAYARSLPGIDPARVILFGSSFSGGHVILAASRDPAVAAVIAQCPFTDGLASALTIGPLPRIAVALRALRDAVGARLGAAPVMVKLAGRPGETALMNRPDVIPGYRGLVPPGLDVPDEVAARVGLAIAFHFPGFAASRVGCPILFCVCDRDSVAPARATLRHVRRAPNGEIRRYPCGHFDIYKGDDFARVIADMQDFLSRRVPI